ncbi:MAG: arylsulfotransferase family protein [Rubrivivax sp.]
MKTTDASGSGPQTPDPGPSSAPPWQRRLWLAACLLTLVLFSAFSLAWAVRHAVLDGPRLSPGQKQALIGLATFPWMVGQSLQQLRSSLANRPDALLLRRSDVEHPAWSRRFPAPEDPGYLLLSTVDASAAASIVKLVRIADGQELARWTPHWPQLYTRLSSKPFAVVGDPAAARAIHPLLLPDGDIVFNTTHGLVRLPACGDTPRWVLDEHIHHSVELADDGTLWVPGVATDGLASNPWLQAQVQDDALVQVSQDGRVLRRISVIGLLRRHGLQAMAVGQWGGVPRSDPIHLNQITPALTDGQHWKRGDLLVSMRNTSTVLLYRPSSDEILWHRSGPWLNQHDARFVGSDRISVFDNHAVVAAPPEPRAFLQDSDRSRIFLVNLAKGTLEQPYARALEQVRLRSPSQGRSLVLDNGDVFVEDTPNGRLMRLSRDAQVWAWVNDYDSEHIGLLNWSRYLQPAEVQAALAALAQRHCKVGR